MNLTIFNSAIFPFAYACVGILLVWSDEKLTATIVLAYFALLPVLDVIAKRKLRAEEAFFHGVLVGAGSRLSPEIVERLKATHDKMYNDKGGAH